MKKENKTRSEYILDALLTGKTLLLSDITRMVSEASGKEIKIQDTSSLMARLSNSRQFHTGHFINKNKTPQGYEYSLVPEILNLAPEELYSLTRKIGKDRFTLEMALEKIPELAQYVKKASKSAKPAAKRKPAIKKPVKKKAASRKKASAGKSKAKAKAKAKAGSSKAAKGKPGRKPLPKPPEPLIQKANVEDVVAGFLNELDKKGGLRVNFYLTVRVMKG
jgi:stage III sporulation protein SpoIIIAA